MALPIYTHIPNLKGLTKIFLKLSRPKGNLCGGGGGVTVLNPKYPRLSSGDTMKKYKDQETFTANNVSYIKVQIILVHRIMFKRENVCKL